MPNGADEREKREREKTRRYWNYMKTRRYWNYMERRHKGDRKKK